MCAISYLCWACLEHQAFVCASACNHVARYCHICCQLAKRDKRIADWLQNLFVDPSATWCMPTSVWSLATDAAATPREAAMSEDRLAIDLVERIASPPQWTGSAVEWVFSEFPTHT